MYVLVHVDDCLIVGSIAGVSHAKGIVKTLFEVKALGPVGVFLGLDVVRDRSAHKLWLGQPRYVQSMLEEFNMTDCKPRVSPLDTGLQLSKDGDLLTADAPYSALIGSLLYLATSTRPDIAHAVGMLSRFVSSPRVEHWNAAKSVLRYLAGTSGLGLFYGDRTKQFIGYTDSDYAGDVNQRKSTSGYVFMYGGAAVAWSSKLQTVVATSTCEAELIAAARAVKEALYFGKLLTDICGRFRPLTVCVDNQSAIVLLRNPAAGAQNRTKHVDVCYNFARHRVAVGDVKVEYIPTGEMIADVMTKQLSGPTFRGHRSNLGMSGKI
jgi:Reverse transcriptase (RNA-dependent DNA polymerase)